ncbi:MAG TPA: hypothetical protein VHE81_13335, partial [Lacipirellulaceae bacterium]|nr:hypothetical protein [Lacipirellulaceae bacterium]
SGKQGADVPFMQIVQRIQDSLSLSLDIYDTQGIRQQVNDFFIGADAPRLTSLPESELNPPAPPSAPVATEPAPQPSPPSTPTPIVTKTTTPETSPASTPASQPADPPPPTESPVAPKPVLMPPVQVPLKWKLGDIGQLTGVPTIQPVGSMGNIDEIGYYDGTGAEIFPADPSLPQMHEFFITDEGVTNGSVVVAQNGFFGTGGFTQALPQGVADLSVSTSFGDTAPAPEPSTLVFCGLALVAAFGFLRRRA